VEVVRGEVVKVEAMEDQVDWVMGWVAGLEEGERGRGRG
jgi:hypothetical protein